MKVIELPKLFLFKEGYLKKSISTIVSLSNHKEKIVGLVFSKLISVRKGDLLVLAAQIEKINKQNGVKLYRKGALPTTLEVKKILKKENLCLHYNSKTQIDYDNFDIDKFNSNNPKYIESFTKDIRKICPVNNLENNFRFQSKIEEFCVEIIGNAIEHGIHNKNINCWLTSDYNYNTKTIEFTFVDMGVGIIQSYKNAGLPFKYKIIGNKWVLIDSLYAKLGSSTKELNRGRGLPDVRKFVENEFISNFVMITNNVSLQYKNNRFEAIRNENFVGTYYSWTVDSKNYQKWISLN